MQGKNYLIIACVIAAVAVGFLIAYIYSNKAIVKARLKELEKTFNSPEFKETVRKVMAKAEELIVGTERGQERLKYVCGVINSLLPVYLQSVVTAERLEKLVNALFKEFAVKEDGHTVVKA